MKYILGGRCTFRGHEFFQSEIISNLVAHDWPWNQFSVLGKRFLVHENQPLKTWWKFHAANINTMISVFMAIKNGFIMGFSTHFQGIFMEKGFIVSMAWKAEIPSEQENNMATAMRLGNKYCKSTTLEILTCLKHIRCTCQALCHLLCPKMAKTVP